MRRSTRGLVIAVGAVAVIVGGGLSAAAFAGTTSPHPVPSASTARPAPGGTATAVPVRRTTASAVPTASTAAGPTAVPSASATARPGPVTTAVPVPGNGGHQPTASALPVTG